VRGARGSKIKEDKMNPGSDWFSTGSRGDNDEPDRAENRYSGREGSVEYSGSFSRTVRDDDGNEIGSFDIRDLDD